MSATGTQELQNVLLLSDDAKRALAANIVELMKDPAISKDVVKAIIQSGHFVSFLNTARVLINQNYTSGDTYSISLRFDVGAI